jgi:sulfate-transporting ATPase
MLKEYEEINLKFSEPMSDDEMNQLIEKPGGADRKARSCQCLGAGQ